MGGAGRCAAMRGGCVGRAKYFGKLGGILRAWAIVRAGGLWMGLPIW